MCSFVPDMRKEIINRIISVFLLVTLMVPISLQFIHAFKPHEIHKHFSNDLDHIQNPGADCAVFHKQINHNVIDLYFDFEIKIFPETNQIVQVILTETHQIFIPKRSSRDPPFSVV
jgi:hypothetical protein